MMRRVFGWLLVVLCCAAGGAAGEARPEARLVEAQAAFDEATKLRDAGGYSEALARAEHALALREAVLGGSHPDVASCLSLVGDLHRRKGNLAQAEPLIQRALAIQEAALGPNHPSVAQSLNNLAVLYMYQGLFGRASPLLQRTLAIQEAALGPHHVTLGETLTYLARSDVEQGLYDRAEPLFQRALAIREAALGKSHPDVAQTLNNLANLYTDHGLYGRAEPLYQRALTLREAAFGKSHPMIAESIHNLANLYMEQGLYDRAEPRYQRALALYEATLGKNHPTLAAALANLARMRLAQHRLADALPLYTRAFATSEQRLRHEALGFSESRLASFLQHLREGEQTLYTLLREYPKDVRVQRLALGAALLLKGRSVEETANISHTLYRGLGPEDRDTLERLRGLRIQLASLSLAGPGSLSPGDYQQRLKSLADEGDLLEADLAKRSAPLRALTALPPLAEIVDRVAAALPKDGALVEFIAYADKPFLPKPGKPHTRPSSQLRYLALVLFPDASTRAVALGPAEPIDRAASHLRNALANRDASFQLTAQELYQRAFQPLLPLLGKTRRLFLSPDSQLGAVPFAALHDGHGFLLDSFDFSYLTSGRELLTRPQDIPPSSSVFVLADPDFNASPRPASSASGNIPLLAESADSLDRFFSTLRADPVSSTWVPLPGSRQEAESIQRLLPQAQLFLGPEATKQRLLQLSTPGILHLATHGFFLEDAPTPEGSRGVGHFGALGDNRQASHPRNPLLRSGLALAGASEPSKSRPAAALVTALELAGLDLWGTQLVVLSACDTGRGEVQLGQGVQGLRRALVVAGAETVVMSLWKVKDDSTRLLMESYYRNLLAGQGRASALREAMRSLRASRPHPHDWAPFIALGSNAPLRSITPPSREPAGQ